MQIKETSEDPRLQALNKPSNRTADTRGPEKLLPAEPTRRTAKRGETRVRTRTSRRKGERRKEQRKVLLDTRTSHDRRKTSRRAEDRNSVDDQASPWINPGGLDIEC